MMITPERRAKLALMARFSYHQRMNKTPWVHNAFIRDDGEPTWPYPEVQLGSLWDVAAWSSTALARIMRM